MKRSKWKIRKDGKKKEKRKTPAIQAFLGGSCTLIFILSKGPEGIELMSKKIADGYVPGTAWEL